MIRLNLPKEPYWIALPHDVRVRVRVLTTAVYEAARTKGWRMARELVVEHEAVTEAGGTVAGLPDLTDPDAVAGLSQFLFAQALAVSAVFEWEGVFDAEGKAALPVTAENVKSLMHIHGLAERFVERYTATHTALVMEGNGSGTAPNGISATVPDTAAAARPSKPPARKAGKARTASAAPIPKTRRSRSKGTQPGRS